MAGPASSPPSRASGRGVWLPYPATSALLVAAWLLLQQSLSFANVLAALLMGCLVPRLVVGFMGPASAWRRPRVMLRLLVVVLWDIVVSNLVVARIVLWPGSRPRPAWVVLPLELTHPTGIALLASIITTTPGTVSCVVDEERRTLLVHALDCDSAEGLVQTMKQRYEAPLKEIFG